MSAWMLPVPVLLPLLSAGIALVAARRPRIQKVISVLTLASSLGFGIVILISASSAPLVLDVGSWAAPIGITLVGDRLSALMLVVSQVVTLGVMVYSIGQDVADSSPSAPIAVYHPTFLVLVAGVSNAFLTGDLFNLYVGFEILLAASFVLITLGGTRGRVRAGTVYVVVSLVSSAIFLMAIALIYGALGTVNMAQLATRIPDLDPNMALLLQLMLLVAFGIKAAVFPLSAWLPDSYPTAPAQVTAVFAGLLTKVGVYAIMRLQFTLFPENHLQGLLTTVGILTMLTGILGAIAQDDVKRMLSFTLVSHIGFMIWGIALGSFLSVASSIYYAAHHILVQTTLFLIVGLIERKTGTTSAARLSNMVKTAPFIAILFIISAMNLVGIPPFSGFIGKLGLAQSSAQMATPAAWCLLAAGLVTSFLTLYAIIKIWNRAFWQTPKDSSRLADKYEGKQHLSGREERQLKRAKAADRAQHVSHAYADAARTDVERGGGSSNGIMYGTVVALTLVQAAMFVFAGPVFSYSMRASEAMLEPGAYAAAVLGEAGRGSGTSADNPGGIPFSLTNDQVRVPFAPPEVPEPPDIEGDSK